MKKVSLFGVSSEHLERDALAAAAMAFAPATEVPRDRAVMRSALVSLVADFPDTTFTKIQAIDSIRKHGELIELRDVYAAEIFEKLVEQKALLLLEESPEGYRVSEDVCRSLRQTAAELDTLFGKVVNRLFGDLSKAHYHDIKSSLLRCLAKLMGDYGRQYAYQVAGRTESSFSPRREDLVRICQATVTKQSDASKMADAIASLYSEDDPAFARFSFYLAQNYYFLSLLGLTGGLSYFSQERFRGAEMFVDTNLLFHFLMPGSSHHRSVLELSELALQLKITFHISELTLEEFKAVIAYEQTLAKVYDEVPEELVSNIKRSGFFHAYRNEKKKNPELNTGDFFASLNDPRERLAKEWGINVLDKHFDSPTDLEFARRAKEEIKQASNFYRRKSKSENALEHDTHLLQLIRSEREDFGTRSAWVLTLDSSLIPAAKELRDANEPPWCMALDGFLQILSPYVRADQQQDFAENFLRVISRNLFTPDDVLEIDDFRMFADMDLSIRRLPAKDIKRVIGKVRDAVGDDIHSTDKKQLAYEVQKAFSDPTLAYRTKHEEDILILQRAKDLAEFEKRNAEQKISDISMERNAQIAQIEASHTREMAARQAETDNYKSLLDRERVAAAQKEQELLRLSQTAKEEKDQEVARQKRRLSLISASAASVAIVALAWLVPADWISFFQPNWIVRVGLTTFGLSLFLGACFEWASHTRVAVVLSSMGVVVGLAKLVVDDPLHSSSGHPPAQNGTNSTGPASRIP
jgi:predicted nucleic acid-binding protein